ncbi:hypothetical protein IID10_15030, partial [candidate division KSB1 bacterium]|nr:hypothetical protein [candidate division KSB1 bacterium]
KIEYLTADIDQNEYIAQANAVVKSDGKFKEPDVLCRYKTDFPRTQPKNISYMDVSPLQIVSVAASLSKTSPFSPNP